MRLIGGRGHEKLDSIRNGQLKQRLITMYTEYQWLSSTFCHEAKNLGPLIRPLTDLLWTEIINRPDPFGVCRTTVKLHTCDAEETRLLCVVRISSIKSKTSTRAERLEHFVRILEDKYNLAFV